MGTNTIAQIIKMFRSATERSICALIICAIVFVPICHRIGQKMYPPSGFPFCSLLSYHWSLVSKLEAVTVKENKQDATTKLTNFRNLKWSKTNILHTQMTYLIIRLILLLLSFNQIARPLFLSRLSRIKISNFQKYMLYDLIKLEQTIPGDNNNFMKFNR